MKPVPWSTVALAGIIVVGLVVLMAMNKDTGPLMALGGAILVGIGLLAGQQQGVRENVNGNMARMLQMLELMAHRMGDAPPLPPVDQVVRNLPSPSADREAA